MASAYEVEMIRLKSLIEEWNSNRLDLFALSQPNENLEFFGVMRFFYQGDDEKVSTKCIRVASTATTRDVMSTLIEKFRPDMRMLSSAQYALYEVHVNGEERPLKADELPLLVQLHWGKDDREGRFLLKKENDKTYLPKSTDSTLNTMSSVASDSTLGPETQFNRKLSKREKKDLKKKEKELKLETPVSDKENIAQRLYNELPESSFTRSISNPELVMRKRRQLKLEKKLQQIRSNDGGPDSGGTLKIYGSDINPDVPYKTLLLSITDNAAHVIRETLEKYGMEREDPSNFRLVQVLVPPEGPDSGRAPKECVLSAEDCPLAILLQHPVSKGTMMFYLRRGRATNTASQSTNLRAQPASTRQMTAVPPFSKDAKDQAVVRHHDVPQYDEAPSSELKTQGNVQVIRKSARQVRVRPPKSQKALQSSSDVETPKSQRPSHSGADFETTFDVDGHVETIVGHTSPRTVVQEPEPDFLYGPPGYEPDLLPAMLTYKDEGEDQLLGSVVNDVNGSAMQFRLAPAYTLYMSLRSRASRLSRPDLSASERDRRVNTFANKVVRGVNYLIQGNQFDPGTLSFWLANASELLNFMKRDADIGRSSFNAQYQLAETIQGTFSLLIDCFQMEIVTLMPAFLGPTSDDSNILQLLTTAMTLLRRCRVNAALTIQMFSQLFHFISVWLFNRVAFEQKPQLCTREWGHRLRKHLGHLHTWAEKQGLELAADCHLAKVIQMALILEAPKSEYDMQILLSSCDTINSLQLRALLCNYVTYPGETPLSSDVISRLVKETANYVDRQLLADGREVVAEESLDLQLPFLLPEDGFSCDFVKGMPPGLAEFIDIRAQAGLCRMTLNPNASGLWTVYFTSTEESSTDQNLKVVGSLDSSMRSQIPEVMIVSLRKLNNSLGLSIVAAKSDVLKELAIYIKAVVPGGTADQDGRLKSGDQLVAVNGESLVGVSQEIAAQIMSRAGQHVTLKVAKQAAVYHGLAQLLKESQPNTSAEFDSRSSSSSSSLHSQPHHQQQPQHQQLQHHQQQPQHQQQHQQWPLQQQQQPSFSNGTSQLDVKHISPVPEPIRSFEPRDIVRRQDPNVYQQFEYRPKSEFFEHPRPQQGLGGSTHHQGIHRSADNINQTSLQRTAPFMEQYGTTWQAKSSSQTIAPSMRQPGYATRTLFPQSQYSQPKSLSVQNQSIPRYSVGQAAASSTMAPPSQSPISPSGQPVSSVSAQSPSEDYRRFDAQVRDSYRIPQSAAAAGTIDYLASPPPSTRRAAPPESYQNYLEKLESAPGVYDGYDNEFPPPPSEVQLEQLKSTNSAYNVKPGGGAKRSDNVGDNDYGFAEFAVPIRPTSLNSPTKKPPPVPTKPKMFAGSPASFDDHSESEPKPRDSEYRESEQKQSQRLLEIRRLESRPYLTANEQAKLSRLRIEAEFDRRLKETEMEENNQMLSSSAPDYAAGGFRQFEGRSTEEEPNARINQHWPVNNVDSAAPSSRTSSSPIPSRPPLPAMHLYSLGARTLPDAAPQSDAMGYKNNASVLQSNAAQYSYNTSLTSERQGGVALQSSSTGLSIARPPQKNFSPDIQQLVLSHAEQKAANNLSENGDTTSQQQSTAAPVNTDSAAAPSQPQSVPKTRGGIVANSALKNPDSISASATKKCVSFNNENMVTEYSFNRSYGSTSSESSFPPNSPSATLEGVQPPRDSSAAGDVFGNGQEQGYEPPGLSLLYGTQSLYPYRGTSPLYGSTGNPTEMRSNSISPQQYR